MFYVHTLTCCVCICICCAMMSFNLAVIQVEQCGLGYILNQARVDADCEGATCIAAVPDRGTCCIASQLPGGTNSNVNQGGTGGTGSNNGTVVSPGSAVPTFRWNGLTLETIVAIGAGGLLLLASLALLTLCCCYKRARRRKFRESQRLGSGTELSSIKEGIVNPMTTNGNNHNAARPKSVAPHYPRPTSIARTAATGGMPKGWEAAIDESSGDTYYFHEDTGETQWEFPMAPRIAQ